MSMITGTAKDLLPGDVAYIDCFEYEIVSVELGETQAELTVKNFNGETKTVGVHAEDEIEAYRKPANATELRHVTNGDRFVIDQGFGPEEHTATEDAKKSTAHTVEEIWYVRTTNYDGRDAHVKATPSTPIRMM